MGLAHRPQVVHTEGTGPNEPKMDRALSATSGDKPAHRPDGTGFGLRRSDRSDTTIDVDDTKLGARLQGTPKMSVEPTNKYNGMTLSDWIRACPNELDIDAVGLWQIVPTMCRSFGLSGGALDRAVRDTLHALLARGALPVVGSMSDGVGRWTYTPRYGKEASAIVEAVIAEWHAMGRDPDVGDVWFAPLHLHGPAPPADFGDGSATS